MHLCKVLINTDGGSRAGRNTSSLLGSGTTDESEAELISPQSQREYVLRSVEERGIRFVQLWFTDVLGTPKGFTIAPAELENALEEGMTFDGSAVDGFSRVQESDVLAVPDPNTFQVLPWRVHDAPVARMVCDIVNLDGTPFEGCPRHVLARALGRARERGFNFYSAPELEYFYFTKTRGCDQPEPLDSGTYFELLAGTSGGDLRSKTVLTLEDMGIPVEHAQHEDAPSQHEIDLRYTDAMAMADTVMTVRVVVKEMAKQHGVEASFMPKPLQGVQGSGMHTHFSLFEGDTNAFYDPGDQFGLSKVAKGFIAGLLRHAPELTAVTNQWVNSYKRLVVGYEAPVYISWARNNRSALVRVPLIKGGRAEAARVEYRAPDPACNPYLSFAVILGAGLAGIENGYELPEEATANVYSYTAAELAAEGIQPLPGSLSEAVDVMAGSELVADVLGEHVFEWFLRNKREEWAEYKAHVSRFEIDRYLGTL